MQPVLLKPGIHWVGAVSYTHLAAPITLRRPGDLVLSIKHLEHSPAYKTELRTAWQNEISRNHLYRHRIRAIWEMAKKLDATSFRV